MNMGDCADELNEGGGLLDPMNVAEEGYKNKPNYKLLASSV